MTRNFRLVVVTMLVASLMLGCDAPRLSTSSPRAFEPTAVPIALSKPTQEPTAVSAVSVASVASGNVVASLQTSLEQLYEAVNPSVVSIRVGSSGAASGFVWDTSGHVVTNNHVVAGGGPFYVEFSDGTLVQGTVVGTDPDSDLAVLKVDQPAEKLKPVTVADSQAVKVGQLVVAIGNPYGLQNTMTVGFVSATGRGLPVNSDNSQPSYSIPDVIQTDAAINPGNSGGVLVDSQGRLIGVTSDIVSGSNPSAGGGLAVPSAIVKNVIPVLIETGKYEHSWLGLTGRPLTPDVAKAMDLPEGQRGALVVAVVSGGPSDKAGLRASDRQVTIGGQQTVVGGDIIVGVDGEPVQGLDDVIAYLSRSTRVGQTITLEVLRDGKTVESKVTLGARPKS
jgi:serine protease Do